MNGKKIFPIIILIILPFLMTGCQQIPLIIPQQEPSQVTQQETSPFPQQEPPTSYATPFDMRAIIGEPVAVISLGDNWRTYNDPNIVISIKYPPDWEIAKVADPIGVGFYPTDFDLNTTPPAILIIFLERPYTAGKPLLDTGISPIPIMIAGISGQQYQDSEFSLPTQSSYIELPYRQGILFIETMEGPILDFTAQLLEMLKTLDLSGYNPPATNIPMPTAPEPTQPPIVNAQPVLPQLFADLNYMCLEGPAVSFPHAVDVYQGSTHNIIGRSGNNPSWYMLAIDQPNTHHKCCWIGGGVVSGDLNLVPYTEALCQ